jgi:lipopolysaccharide export system permease protein
MSIVLIITIVIVFDWSEKVNDFVGKNAPLKEIIFDYYVNFVPYFINMFSSLFVFISVIFFTTKMAQKNEFIAFYSAGITTKRIFMPYLGTALILVLLNFYLTNFLIPDVNVKRLAFENKYISGTYYNSNSNVHFQQDDTTFFYVSHFDNRNGVGYRMTKEIITPEGLVYKFSSESAHFKPTHEDSIDANGNVITQKRCHNNTWILYNFFERRLLDSIREEISSNYTKTVQLPIVPEDFAVDITDVNTLNFNKLNNFLKREKEKGSKNLKAIQYEKYQRIAHPFVIVILTFLGFIVSVQKKKSGMGYNLAFGLACGFMFIVFLQFSRVFAVADIIPVWFAAWMPILIFASLSMCFIKNLQR